MASRLFTAPVLRTIGAITAPTLLTLTAPLMAAVPNSPGAETARPTSPADFATAVSACLRAVSTDKLDPGTLDTLGWKKSGDHSAPYGKSSIYELPGNSARILASATPSGFCIVDGLAQNATLFDGFQGAVKNRLQTDFAVDGLTDVKLGSPGALGHRQGVLVGNAVGSLSFEVRQAGPNLRFTAVNVKHAGSAKSFQTARPPLSDAEIAENSAQDRAAADNAKLPGTAQDLVIMANDCATALRGNGALPGNGWRKSIHASGSPRGVAALKARDMKAMMAGMAHTRQSLYHVERRGVITKYFVRGVTTVCEATVYVDPIAADTLTAEAKTAMALGKDKALSGKAKDFVEEYLITDFNRTYQWGQSEAGFRTSVDTGVNGPDAGKSTVSIFIF